MSAFERLRELAETVIGLDELFEGSDAVIADLAERARRALADHAEEAPE